MPGFSCSYKRMDVAKSAKGVPSRLDSIALSDLSSLTDFRATLRSHHEAQKSHGKQIHRLMEYSFLEYFHFYLADLSTPQKLEINVKNLDIWGKKPEIYRRGQQQLKPANQKYSFSFCFILFVRWMFTIFRHRDNRNEADLDATNW